MRVAALYLAGALLVSACAGPSTVGRLRFKNQAPVWKVNDRLKVSTKPEERPFRRMLYFFDAYFFRALTEAMEMKEPVPALNVNSLGEVPDSTWFTNRIGGRDMDPSELIRGPNTDDGPDRSGTWTVTGSKVGGISVGFIIKDARGTKFIIKFDQLGIPVIETATDVVLQRLLWALGYNVPEDTVVYFHRDLLQLAKDASIKDVFGNERPMTVADLEEALSKVNRQPDGSYRALASKFLPGAPIGGFAQKGVRHDDPNDRIPHEHRREVRALYLFYSWLQATDVKEDNTLDVWQPDPGDPEHRYVVHYLVDFGKSLGANALIPKFAADNHANVIDFEQIAISTLTLGLRRRPWEGTAFPDMPGVGMMDVEHYSPGGYKPQARYTPFEHVDVHDMFWAAKVLIRLTPEHIRVAVEQGRYEDPRAAEYVRNTLIGRQRKGVRYWFRKVNPLDAFQIREDSGALSLCFDDLLIKHKLDDKAAAVTTYRAASYDFDGKSLGAKVEARPLAGSETTACFASGLKVSGARDGYTIIRVDTERGEKHLEPIEVHLARTPETNEVRIIGIHRH